MTSVRQSRLSSFNLNASIAEIEICEQIDSKCFLPTGGPDLANFRILGYCLLF
jgi:hypothetical protein